MLQFETVADSWCDNPSAAQVAAEAEHTLVVLCYHRATAHFDLSDCTDQMPTSALKRWMANIKELLTGILWKREA